MANLWRCQDRWGREIVLTDARWHAHIVHEHRAMAPHRDLVRQTVESPEEVKHDRTKASREVFYRRWRLSRHGRLVWLKVVVRFTTDPRTLAERGTVVTAYPTNRQKPGERHKWP